MTPVPSIQTNVLRKSDHSKLGMPKRSLEIRWLERLQQRHPARVKRFEQRERNFDRRRARVLKLSPAIFVIRLDGWFFFGERELEPAIAVQVTVGHVMDYLANGPTAGPIRSVELFRG